MTQSNDGNIDACGDSGPLYLVSNSSYQYISSPNYPNNYSTNSMCSWVIGVQPGQKVTVRVYAFQLEEEYVIHIVIFITVSSKLCISRYNTLPLQLESNAF